MVADDEPLPAGPAVGEAVPRFDDRSRLAEVEGVDAAVYSGIASDRDPPPVDRSGGLVLQKVREVIAALGGVGSRLVRHRGQQDGILGVILDDFLRVTGCERGIPAIERAAISPSVTGRQASEPGLSAGATVAQPLRRNTRRRSGIESFIAVSSRVRITERR